MLALMTTNALLMGRTMAPPTQTMTAPGSAGVSASDPAGTSTGASTKVQSGAGQQQRNNGPSEQRDIGGGGTTRAATAASGLAAGAALWGFPRGKAKGAPPEQRRWLMRDCASTYCPACQSSDKAGI